EEVLDPARLEELAAARQRERSAAEVLQELTHVLNNRLNSTAIGLALLRRQLQLGRTQDMAATLERLEQEFHTLKQRMENAVAEPAAMPAPGRRRALLVEDDRNEC